MSKQAKTSWQKGQANMEKLVLETPSGASADIYRYGAQLTRWQTASGKNWIFLSEQARFEPGQAIRGGVPVIFPQFGGFGSGPHHGFARLAQWQLRGRSDQNGATRRATFVLDSSDSTLDIWPHKFGAEYSTEISENQLIMTLKITNTDRRAFDFSAGLHTYFAVKKLDEGKLLGLQDVMYWDNDGTDFEHRKAYSENTLNFSGPIDRVFFNCTRPLDLIDGDDRLQIATEGFNEVVVWNPGSDAARGMVDLADHEYQHMLCVEAAVIDRPVRLEPGEEWQGRQILSE